MPEIHCDLNKGPFGSTYSVTKQGENQQDTENSAINEAEQKAHEAQHALLMSCPNDCPRAANIKGEIPIKAKIVRSRPRKKKFHVPAIKVKVNTPWGLIEIETQAAIDLEVEIGWEATANAEWRIDSFECLQGWEFMPFKETRVENIERKMK